VDANVLFSAAYRQQAGLAILWKLRRTRLLTSLYAAQEAANNLDTEDQQLRLRDLLENMEIVSDEVGMDIASQRLLAQILLPDKDRPILAAAVAAKADFLLTGDIQHFGRYFGQAVGGVRILRPAEFLPSSAESP
jgi:predicted nucleic acid-binding protein